MGRRLADREDAYGQALMDFFRGKEGFEIVERDDGFFGPSSGPASYLSGPKAWPAHEKEGLRFARGRVLDVGCGAGRFALYLQERGHEVMGIDVSPLAVEVCRLRGVKDARVMSITEVSPRLGTFDTVLMYGNNFGLFGSPERAKRLLRRFGRMTSGRARIIAESNSLRKTSQRCHLEYHEFNRRRGRLPGHLTIRIRYLKHVTPWFDYLMVSPDEMKEIVRGTDWQVRRVIESKGSSYVAVVEKEARGN